MKYYKKILEVNPLKLKLLILFIASFCFATLAHSKNRSLLIVSELDQRGVKELASLYKTLEKLTWSIPSKMPLIDSIYLQQKLLTGKGASIEGSQGVLIRILRDPQIDQVDLILGVHGLPNKLAFSDGVIEVDRWVEELKSKLLTNGEGALLNKLGLLYNLSCYGASHIPSFLGLGFQVVVGSRSVNANAELEYPWVLQMLATGASVESAFSQPNSDGWLNFADGPVRWIGRKQNSFLKDTDSYKVIGGNGNYKLTF